MFNPTKTVGKRLQASHGMVLMSALTILTVLLAVGIGIRVMLQNDYRVLSNLRGRHGSILLFSSRTRMEQK